MRRGLGLLLAVLGLIAAPAGVGLAQGAAPGAIEGRLVNRTAGGAVPAEVEVVLHVFRGETHAEDRPARTDAAGRFTFPGLETDSVYAYQVTAAYAGVGYAAEPLRFGLGVATTQSVELAVYESTGEDPGLRVRRATVVLAGTDAASQTLRALEMVMLENPSDRTYRPSATGVAGPMGLLRFPLPPQAGDLRRGPGLEEAQIVQVDRGFATDLPIPPGTREVLFSYRFPYRPGRTALSRSVPYPTAELRVIAPGDGPRVAGPGLAPAEPLELGGWTYRVWVARDLPAGAPVELALDGLPSRWPFGLPLADVPSAAWGGLGAGLALAVVGGAAWAARRRAVPPAAAPVAERRALVESLAALDDAFADGTMPAAVYQAARADGTARLRELLRLEDSGRAAASHAGTAERGRGPAVTVRVEGRAGVHDA